MSLSQKLKVTEAVVAPWWTRRITTVASTVGVAAAVAVGLVVSPLMHLHLQLHSRMWHRVMVKMRARRMAPMLALEAAVVAPWLVTLVAPQDLRCLLI